MCIFHDSVCSGSHKTLGQQKGDLETTVGEDLYSNNPPYLILVPIAIEGGDFRAQEQTTKLASRGKTEGTVDEDTPQRPIIQPARAKESALRCREIWVYIISEYNSVLGPSLHSLRGHYSTINKI